MKAQEEAREKAEKAQRQADAEKLVMGLAGSQMVKAARDMGLKTAEEVFADRIQRDIFCRNVVTREI